MTWIRTVSYEQSAGRLREAYDRVRGPGGHIDNILRAHSLRPHTLEGHMALYKSALHHSGNRLPRWLLEAIGVYVSVLNGCRYCVAHHATGLERELGDPQRRVRIQRALDSGRIEDAFEAREQAVLRYVERLTRSPERVAEADLQPLREAGLEDGEILEVNQVAAYFAYANRTVLGLGVSTEGEPLGLAPRDSDDPTEWRHS